jgi:hypothetical protein
MSDSFVDKVISVIPMPTIAKKRRKPAGLSLAARKRKLGALQKALGKLVRDVEKLAKSIATEEKKARPAARPQRKQAAKRK